MIPPVLEASCFSGSLHICRCFASAWGHRFLVNLAWYMRSFLPVFCKVNKDNINQMPQPLKKTPTFFLIVQSLFAGCSHKLPSWLHHRVILRWALVVPQLLPPWALHEENWQIKNLAWCCQVWLCCRKMPGKFKCSLCLVLLGLPSSGDALVGGSGLSIAWVPPSPPAWPVGMSQGAREGAGARLQAVMCWEDG